MKHLSAYLLTIPLVLILDFVWLGLLMPEFYAEHIGHLMSGTVVWGAAAVFYVLYSAGLFYFAVLPAISGGSAKSAVIRGALIGLLAYGTYDLTNHAILTDWPLIVTVIDMVWGAFLSAVVAGSGFFIARALARKTEAS